MSRMTISYDLGRRHDACAATGEPLKPGDEFVACLADDPESDDLLRLDYSAKAWDEGARPDPPRAVFACWHAVVPEPGAKPGFAIDASSLTALFEQLGDDEEANDPRRLALRFVIALMLMRKKHLVFEGQAERDGGTKVMLLRERGTPPEHAPVEVIDPQLDEDTLASVTEQLSRIIQVADS
ncbi:MAG: hypothetical protein RLN60_02735 [Phycisphaerales bacterium]